ncbi:bifunctional non-homologous end joining protein LigD [Heliophilum fasciatum]|uniref:Bifunctional non-homologous end joining protein LigD n=1 Tax=Heliophilum fasciatum TaxID=35700 RepID=A0A4R2RCQ1_9FIRM|nr:bifunctional non-homologous end joining protein LigD [Heliophilum fasciatum]
MTGGGIVASANGEAKPLTLSNTDKIFWPQQGYTKGDLLMYYAAMAPVLLPHLRGYPLVLVRYPDGIEGKFFYQKQAPDHRPSWLPTVTIPSSGSDGTAGEGKKSASSGRAITYCMVNDEADLLWLINAGCIEVHPWLSMAADPDKPTAMVFDLDPAPGQDFRVVIEVALCLQAALKTLGLKGYVKTSGASGLHLFVPIAPLYPYAVVREAAVVLAQMIAEVDSRVTLERHVEERGQRLYLDCWQMARAKTLASVYSVRPVPGATVSTPLLAEELSGENLLDPRQFTIKNLPDRVAQVGDLFAPVLQEKNDLRPLLSLTGAQG